MLWPCPFDPNAFIRPVGQIFRFLRLSLRFRIPEADFMHPKNRMHAIKCFWPALFAVSAAFLAIGGSSLLRSIASILRIFPKNSGNQKFEYDPNDQPMQ